MASVKDVENHSLPPVDVHFLNDRRWRTDHRNSESTRFPPKGKQWLICNPAAEEPTT